MTGGETREEELQEFVDLLFTPMPSEAAREFVKLCREELAEIVADPAAGQEVSNGEVDEQFEKVFEVAVRLKTSQRRRLITSLVNYEVLRRKRAKICRASSTDRELNDDSDTPRRGTFGRLSNWLSSWTTPSRAVG